MQYRRYGNTGIMVSALGFGAMRFPHLEDGTCDYEKAVPMLQRGIEMGINYIDSAWGYIKGTSEVAVGKAIKRYDRGKLYLSTKIPIEAQSGAEWREQLETQLQRLDTDYIDFHNMHSLRWNVFVEKAKGPGKPLAAALQAQEEGLIRHICFSCHDTVENIKKLIDTGIFSGMTVQYNLLDRHNEPAIAYAYDHGLGITIMGPVGGGRLGFPSEAIQRLIPGGAKSTPEIALRFVLANPAVSLALSGMNEMRQIEENVATASREEPLSQAELAQIAAALDETERLAELYCTGCGYCMPCPNEVNIPENFKYMNYYRVYGLREYAHQAYAKLGTEGQWVKGLPASACLQCGECEPKCPQNIPIIERLEEVAATLG